MTAESHRADGWPKVTGTATYTIDVALPGMLHAAVLRSPHAHARINGIDARAARAEPGVVAVLTGDHPEARRCFGWRIADQPVLAAGRTRYAGEIVAAVAAVDVAAATAAVRRIEVDYRPLSPLMSIDAALAPQAPALFEQPPVTATDRGRSRSWLYPATNVCYRFAYRDGDAAELNGCDEIFLDTFTFPAMQHYHLEPFVSVADASADALEVWSSTQNPFGLRQSLAGLFDYDEEQVRVHAPLVGGAFGAKNGLRAEPVAVLLSRATGRPVRFCMTAAEAFLTQRQHAATIRLRTGVMADGTLVGRQCEVLLDAGAYSDASPQVAEKAAYRAPGPYRWRHVDTVASCVLTTTTPAGAFRGFGGPQVTWASETQLDMIARRLGIDPFDLRMKNLRELGEPYQPGDAPLDSDLRAGLRAVADAIGYHDSSRRPARRGLGLAVGLKDAGGGRKRAAAEVTVDPAGSVRLSCGTVELGQGAYTALRNVVARILAMRPDEVAGTPIDTAVVPYDQGTYASSSSTVMGTALATAADSVRRQVLGALSRPPDGELPQDWRSRVAGQRFTGRGDFAADADPEAPLGERTLFWEPGWAGAEVEVDTETGRVRVVHLVVCGDAGYMLHPQLCHGQELGAAAMGLAQATVERLSHVGERLASHDPLTYRVLSFTDLPDDLELIVQEQGHGPGPFGAKGYGEGGMLVVAAAVTNAVQDATGAWVTSLPITPEVVLAAMDEQAAVRGLAG